jgi:hypothetical protein
MATTAQDDDWTLGVDTQSSVLIQLKQQLTYFLITASMAVIGFVAAFNNVRSGAWDAALSWPTVLATAILTLAGLGCAGLCLLYLYLGNQSFVLHLKYRSQRRTYDELTQAERDHWDTLTRRANLFLELSFVLLFVEIVTTIVFFWLLVTNTMPPPTKN